MLCYGKYVLMVDLIDLSCELVSIYIINLINFIVINIRRDSC
jgi:hypothetical protein